MRKSVTLEGDSFDPAGTLTGGSRPQSSGILSKLSEINDLHQTLTSKQQELAAINSQYSSLRQVF